MLRYLKWVIDDYDLIWRQWESRVRFIHHVHVVFPSGPAAKLLQRAPRRRGQQPKLLNSPEDGLYYNQLNVSSKGKMKLFVRLCVPMIIVKCTCAREPWATPCTSSFPTLKHCCLQHELLLFICCFHVRMSAFTVNNWCGLSKPSKMHASSASPRLSLIKKIMLWLLILSASVRIQRKNHFELKINDSCSFIHLLVFSDSLCVCVSSAENSRLPGEQKEAQKTWVNIWILTFTLLPYLFRPVTGWKYNKWLCS